MKTTEEFLMKNKLFNTDLTKHRYNVLIEVYKNIAVTKVDKIGKDEKDMTYYELIGILEAQKQHIIWTQREANLKKKFKPKSQTAKKIYLLKDCYQ